jgi:hypothetical protein
MPVEVERDAPMRSFEHPLHVGPGRLGLGGGVGGAVETLLLPRHGHEDDRGVEVARGLRAISITAIAPEASSSAPGASQVVLIGLVQIES